MTSECNAESLRPKLRKVRYKSEITKRLYKSTQSALPRYLNIPQSWILYQALSKSLANLSPFY